MSRDPDDAEGEPYLWTVAATAIHRVTGELRVMAGSAVDSRTNDEFKVRARRWMYEQFPDSEYSHQQVSAGRIRNPQKGPSASRWVYALAELPTETEPEDGHGP